MFCIRCTISAPLEIAYYTHCCTVLDQLYYVMNLISSQFAYSSMGVHRPFVEVGSFASFGASHIKCFILLEVSQIETLIIYALV